MLIHDLRSMRAAVVAALCMTACAFAKKVAYEDVANQLQQGDMPQLEEGDQVTMESLKLREKLSGFLQVPIPPQVDPLIESIGNEVLKNVEIKKDILPADQFAKSYAISGNIKIDAFDKVKGEVSLRAIMAQEQTSWKTSIELSMPKNWKLRDVFPKLQNSPIGSVPLPDGQIIFSTFDYKDQEGYDIARGVNIAAHVSLEEVAPELYKAIDKLRPENSGLAQSVVFEGFDKVRLSATIARSIEQTTFDVIVPLRIGVDFQELYKQGTIKRKPTGIRKISTGNIHAQFEGASQEFGFEYGLRVYPTTQEEPLEFRPGAQVDPNEITMTGKMDGQWQITDWLTIDDPAIELNSDFTLISELAAAGVPIPFTGIKVRGNMGLGEGENRSVVELAGGVEISDDPRDLDFLIAGNIDQIKLKPMLEFFSRVAKKRPPRGKIPEITLHDLKLYVVPKDMQVAGKAYEQGLEFGGGLKVSKFSGKANFVIDVEDRRISAEGHLDPIKVGKALAITGKGPDGQINTQDDRAKLAFTFPPEKDQDALLELDGIVQIPALKLQREGQTLIKDDVMTFTVSDTVAGLGMQVSGDLPLKNADDVELHISVQPGAISKLVDQITQEFQKLREQLRGQLESVRQKIAKARKEYEGRVEQEQQRIENEMKKLRTEYQEAKKSCQATEPLKRPFVKACRNQAKLKLEMLAKEKIYKDFLLEKGKKLGAAMSVPGEFAKQAQKLEQHLAKIQNVADRIGKIEDISGSIRAQALNQGEMPTATVKLASGKTFDISLEPKDIVQHIKDAAMQKLG